MTEKASSLALIVGATGIVGDRISANLLDRGLNVVGMSRRAPSPRPGVQSVTVDFTDEAALQTALADIRPTEIYFTAWARMPTEAENIRVNGGMVRDILKAVEPHQSVRHVALMTGLKHYLGPFEAYASGETRDTPFHEEEPRLPTPNFYYAQEDELWKSADLNDFTWSVHRSHTVIGYAVGNAMNIASTLAVQAALAKHRGEPFIFPGNDIQWNGITDMTDADLAARQMIWAAESEKAANQAYNIANGDVFRWRWMWPRIAEMLGVEPEGYQGESRPLEQQMAGPGPQQAWKEITVEHNLIEPDLSRVASWWHTDSDLNRPLECFTDMARSRRLGFLDQSNSLDCFGEAFDRLRREGIIPK
jgi:nucleoside-diphosphate-sugar epimerase